jgi:molecular chaperone DnaK
VLAGDVQGILLLDVTPLSLGVETMGGVMTRMIERNTTIPTKKTEIYSTAADGQTSVEIHVLQGEREMALGNKTLGKFQLSDIPPAPRGIPQIEVTFDIDANGIVNVSAKDKGTGKSQRITISGSTALSDAEVDRMVKDAELHAEEDAARKSEVEVRNTADSLVYSTQKTMADLGEKVPEETKADVSAAIEELNKALADSNVDEIREKTEALQQASYKLAEIVYADASSSPESYSEENATDDGVVEADYEVIDPDENK